LRKVESDETAELNPNPQENELSALESHYSRGNRLFYEEHDYENAIEIYEKALEEENDELIRTKITYLMAESYVKQGKLKKARELFQTLADNYKQHYLNDSARKRIEHLNQYLVEKESKR
jgi:thioredoxin-like negative regulator of GroEL